MQVNEINTLEYLVIKKTRINNVETNTRMSKYEQAVNIAHRLM